MIVYFLVRLAGSVALGLLLTACGGGSGGGSLEPPLVTSAELVSVAPADSNEILLNPGKGWVAYSEFRVKDAAVWNYVTTCYKRYDWVGIQPTGADQFDWAQFDRDLNDCKAKGKKFAFGVIPANSLSGHQETPQWVYAAGAQSYTGNDGKKYPVWSDPVYLNYQRKLTEKLAERFDGSDDIAFIDARNYGNYGEWHLDGIGGVAPSDAVKRQMLEMWSAFKQTDIMVPGDSSTSHVQYGTGTLGLGLRYDSSDNPALTDAGSLAKNVAPAVSEWSIRYAGLKTGSGWTGKVWSDAWIPAYMAGSGYSYDNLGQWDTDSNLFLTEKPELVRTWANRMGYWFRLTNATFPAHLGNGQTATLSFKVRNDGVAPIFVNKKGSVMKLALLNDANQVVGTPVLLSDVKPFDWKPGATTSATSDYTFPTTPGGRKLAIGLFSKPAKTTPDIRFGSAGTTVEGWLVLN